jgi:hypothetical protein
LLTHCAHTHTVKIEVIYFSIVIRAGTLRLKDLFPEYDHFLLVTSIFLLIPFIMNFSQLSEENSDIELSKVFDKLSKTSKNSNKELKKVKQEKESLIV